MVMGAGRVLPAPVFYIAICGFTLIEALPLAAWAGGHGSV